MFEYEAPASLLQDRVILVTGAGRGIGREAALCYAAHGATVILCGRQQADLESVYDAIQQAGGAEPAIQLLDLETAGLEIYQAVAAAVEAEFGQLHGLLHNAALLGPRTPVEQYAAEEWSRLMQVNVHAAFLLTQALMPLLKRADDASVIFTSSGVGRRGRAYWGAYAVSKFAVEGLSQVLADELAEVSAIRVNCINPGATRTAMRKAAYPAEDPETNPTAAEIMPLYLYLMGPDSRGVTGQSLDAQ